MNRLPFYLVTGALLTMIEGAALIWDRNKQYKTPFRILLALHEKALEYQRTQSEQKKEEIKLEKEVTRQEILVDPKLFKNDL